MVVFIFEKFVPENIIIILKFGFSLYSRNYFFTISLICVLFNKSCNKIETRNYADNCIRYFILGDRTNRCAVKKVNDELLFVEFI